MYGFCFIKKFEYVIMKVEWDVLFIYIGVVLEVNIFNSFRKRFL